MAKKEIRFKIGSTEIGSRPDANIIWYVTSCDIDRGTPEIVLLNSNEAKVKKFFLDTKKENSGHYDVHLYIALAVWDKKNKGWNIIDDEVIDSWSEDEDE